MIDRVCEYCGNAFKARPYLVRAGKGRFCSQRCRGRALNPETVKKRPKRGRWEAVSDAELILDMRRVAKELGHAPSRTEYATLGKHDGAYHRRWKLPWPKIVEKCGLRYTVEAGRPNSWNKDKVRKEVERVAAVVGRVPTYRDFRRHGSPYPDTVYRHLECAGWPEVVRKVFGVSEEESLRFRHGVSRQRLTTEEWLEKLRELARRLRHTPSSEEAQKYGCGVSSLYKRIPGGWGAILKAAGLERPSHLAKRVPRREPKQLGHVADPVRDMLKEQSVEAIKEYFKTQGQG